MKLNGTKTLFIYDVIHSLVPLSRGMKLPFILRPHPLLKPQMVRQAILVATAAKSSRTFLATLTPESNI